MRASMQCEFRRMSICLGKQRFAGRCITSLETSWSLESRGLSHSSPEFSSALSARSVGRNWPTKRLRGRSSLWQSFAILPHGKASKLAGSFSSDIGWPLHLWVWSQSFMLFKDRLPNLAKQLSEALRELVSWEQKWLLGVSALWPELAKEKVYTVPPT